MIIYNANPADNYAFATMIGNFQDGTVPGKVQFGHPGHGTYAHMTQLSLQDMIAASPLVLCQTAISPCFPRDRLFALLALALAAALGFWAVSASGIVAAALAIALKWDLVRGFLYATAMFLSPALRWAVGLSVFAGISAICLRAIARPGQ